MSYIQTNKNAIRYVFTEKSGWFDCCKCNKYSSTYGLGDFALARWTEQYYKSKNVKFKVYETTTNQYIPYNGKGSIKK